MKKQYIIGVSLVTLAIAILGSGFLYAYFSDTQAVNGNAFTTGSLMLQVGAASPAVEQINVSGIVPGSSGNVADWQLQNVGTISGGLNVTFSAITDAENTINRAEAAAGDTTPGGELSANLRVAFWVDVDHSGTWTTGDYYLRSDGSKVSYQTGDTGLPAAAFGYLGSYGSRSFADVQTGIAPGTFGYFRADYELPATTGNTVQTDSCAFDILFTLSQG